MRHRIAVLLIGALAACAREGGGGPDRSRAVAAITPAEHAAGDSLFRLNCEPCHGAKAMGSPQGPPLVDLIYRPSHHADAAFLIAAQRGVPAHHWGFGNMPPVPGVTPEQVAAITGYVRWLQQTAGIRD